MTSPAPNPAVRGTITQDHTKGARLKGSSLEEAVTSCARAIGGRDDLSLAFTAAEQEADPLAGRVTRRPPDMAATARAALRGEADLAGLFRAHHAVRPLTLPAEEERLISALERVRVEARGASAFRGVARNLAAALNERCLKPQYTRGPEALLRAETLAILLRESIVPDALPKRSFGFVEARRAALSGALRPYVERFRAALNDQERFASIAAELARSLPSDERSALAEERPEEIESRGDRDPGPVQGDQRSEGEASGLKSATEEATSDAPLFGTAEKSQIRGAEGEASTLQAADDAAPQAARRAVQGSTASPLAYRVFTRSFDRTVAASTLLAERPALPEDQDDAVAEHRKQAARLAGRLRRALMAQQPRGWERDLPEGMLDPTRLARVVTDPASAASSARARTSRSPTRP